MTEKTDLPVLAVKRPLLIMVLNLLIVIAGAAALLGTEVRELPNVDRPIVTVSATLPGAAPETMDGEVTMTIPAGAQSGQTLRLKGKGVSRGRKTGNLYVTLKVVLPKKGDEALAAALKEAEALYEGDVRKEVKA